jgi:hypothetical protein
MEIPMSRKDAEFPSARGRATNVPLQQMHMAHRFPAFTRRTMPGATEWRGTLQPRDTSPAYKVAVKVRHTVDAVPQVRVLRPALAPNAPHLYGDGTLCLYWPEEWHWRHDALIAETILPWAVLWLFHYELWLDCGEWLGPSSHDASPDGRNVA